MGRRKEIAKKKSLKKQESTYDFYKREMGEERVPCTPKASLVNI